MKNKLLAVLEKDLIGIALMVGAALIAVLFYGYTIMVVQHLL
jgi:hypothetical protein